MCVLLNAEGTEREQGICDTKREALEWRGGGGGKIYEWCAKISCIKGTQNAWVNNLMFYHLYYCLKKKVDNDFRRHILGASIQHGLYSGNDDIMSLREDMNIL